MQDERCSSVLLAVIGFGSCWGLAEATIGHLAHMARIPGLAGGMMFPFACLFMALGLRAGRGRFSTLLIAWVAASFKLLDLFWPGSSLDLVLNPFLAILTQGICFQLAWPMRQGGGRTLTLARAAALSLGWRAAYAGIGLTLTLLFAHPNFLQRGADGLLSFFLIEGGANALLAWLLLGSSGLARRLLDRRLGFSPAAALVALLLAVLATVAE